MGGESRRDKRPSMYVLTPRRDTRNTAIGAAAGLRVPEREQRGKSTSLERRAGTSPAVQPEADWYWRGLLLGLLAGVILVLFFTPVSGPDLRERIRSTVEQWQVRIWNLLDRLEGAGG